MTRSFKEILVATVGLTPETVTETIYYYYKQISDKRIFSDFRLITTEKGRVGIIKALFDDGWLGKLEQAIGLKPKSILLTEDNIIVLKDGKIIEQGSHSTLIAKNGSYKKLYDLQYKNN